jgi:flagellar motor switch protein FliN
MSSDVDQLFDENNGTGAVQQPTTFDQGSGSEPTFLEETLMEGGMSAAPSGTPHVFQQFPTTKAQPSQTMANDIDMIMDIPVQLTVELGRTKIAIKSILQLAQGSVVELDGLAGEPMDVLVNGCLIAQGEVVVVNDKFGIRLTDIITPSERLGRLNR